MSNRQLTINSRQQRRAKPQRSIAKTVHAIMNSGPTKFSQALHTEVALLNASNPVYFDFPNPTPGAQENSRLGNTIKCKSLHVDLLLNNNSASTASGMLVRAVLLEVKAGNSFSNSDITNNLFEPTASGTQDVTAYLDIKDISATFNREPFRVLFDEVIIVSPSGPASTNAGIAQFHYSLNRERLLRYQDGDSSSPNLNRYTVLLLARAAANDGAAITVEASGRTAMNFSDHV